MVVAELFCSGTVLRLRGFVSSGLEIKAYEIYGTQDEDSLYRTYLKARSCLLHKSYSLNYSRRILKETHKQLSCKGGTYGSSIYLLHKDGDISAYD